MSTESQTTDFEIRDPSGDLWATSGAVRAESQTTEGDGIMRCPKCGEPHPDKVIAFAKAFGASVALCRKCTAIEKRERFGITNDRTETTRQVIR